jgi:RNA polymerase sigma-70 factor (subfamily 1)
MEREFELPQHLFHEPLGSDRFLGSGTEHDEVVCVSHVAVAPGLEQTRVELLAFIRRRLASSLQPHLEASDVLQIALMRACQRFGQFRGESRGSLLDWLAAIALNVIRDEADYLRRQRRCVQRTVPLGRAADTLAAESRCPARLLIAREEAELVERTLRSLDDGQREAILLRAYEGLGFREIGQRLGKSPDACRMLVARGLRALARKLRAGAPSSPGEVARADEAAAG